MFLNSCISMGIILCGCITRGISALIPPPLNCRIIRYSSFYSRLIYCPIYRFFTMIGNKIILCQGTKSQKKLRFCLVNGNNLELWFASVLALALMFQLNVHQYLSRKVMLCVRPDSIPMEVQNVKHQWWDDTLICIYIQLYQ